MPLNQVAPLDVKLFEHSARIWSERTLTRPVGTTHTLQPSTTFDAQTHAIRRLGSGLGSK